MGKLIQFFHGISVFVNSLYEAQIEPFDRELKQLITRNPNNPMTAFRYNAYLRDIIFQMVLQIRAQFDLFRDITSMYREVHRKCIIVGLERVGESSIPSAKALKDMNETEKAEHTKVIEARREKLKTFTQEAETTINSIVQKVSRPDCDSWHVLTKSTETR